MRWLLCTVLLGFLLSACSGAAVPEVVVTPALGDQPLSPIPSTLTPTPIPSPIALPTLIPKLSGSCQNPFIPLAEGNSWQYQTTYAGEVFQYSLTALEYQKDRTETMLLQFTEIATNTSIQETVLCQDGAIDNFPNYVMDMLLADKLEKFLDTVHLKDPSMPSYDAFSAADWALDWSTVYLTEDTARLADPTIGDALMISRSSELTLAYSMDGTMEVVTVPAGTFEAFKVAHTSEFLVTIPSVYTNSAAAVLIVYSTEWYAPNVGLVKSTLEKATIRSGGMESEIPLEGILELIQFNLK